MKLSLLIKKTARFGIAALALQFHAAPASAHPVLILSGPYASAILPHSMMISTQCYLFSLDQNGNRIAYISSPMSSGAMTWGSSTFGCSIWGP